VERRHPSPSRRLGVAAVVVAALAWSVAAVLVKSSELTGLRFAMYRLWAGAAIFAAVLLATRRRLTPTTFRACALGGVIFGVDISLTFVAFQSTNVADATVIAALSPVVIVLISARWFDEPVGPRERALAAASFVGVAVVAIGSSASPSWSLFGDLAAFAGIATWTAYWFFSRRAREAVPALEYMASVMVAAAAVVTPVAVVAGRGPMLPSASDWISVVAVALIPGLVGHTLVAWSHRYVESWRSALITQSQPVLASVWAWIFLDEVLSPAVIAGIAVVLVTTGVVISTTARARAVVADIDEASEKAS